ncbi:hypothetical protein Kpol_1002p14 [Vanderwaltozyma polyspora DSM 70294]|uniref:37S ribosomal protein S17, mitochondrial n=1 Tax=Vanderwaltozyma polyspora (strain ATCC 22028 / DSM 70294 / BCRC 21397 / CBS 2163 / NBRC 10782 / NRRL Y-8283 / UCD 57-17) TaxID=436907 RepID=A7TE47_VANPO|nr:uncharacterized protein Kpol_1002p14 [Vanderwaltozyma polyspora DSM 70294]EDO19369.1 hypothetical protein Kpol_1002p14 [Vanderwaltozyma polyspora DSM 70294]
MARQNFMGLVVSQGKMQKTVKVRVETKVFNKIINKELFHRKDFLVHDEGEIAREGDLVRIEATRPLSKHKFFAIAEIIRNKGQQFALYEEQAKTQVTREEYMKTQEFLQRRNAAAKSKDSLLLEDIRIIQTAISNGQSPQELKEIKDRYGIQEFTPETIRKLVSLDITKMENEVNLQRERIESVQAKIEDLLSDDVKATEFLKSKGIEEPALLKKNIKKNILKKYVLQELR